MPDSFQLIKANKIAAQTTDAYMYDNYGEKHWIGIACFLLEHSISQAGVIGILRSKHMRWSSDGRDKATLNEFKYYCNKYPGVISEEFAE